MKRWLTSFSAVAALIVLMVLPSFAQLTSAVRGGLGGIVFDATGSVLPNIDVTVTGPQGTYKVKTDAAGRYLAGGLVPGNYSVKVEAAGFKTFISTKNLIVSGSTSNLDIHLTVGAVTDTVQVEAGAVQIDTENTALTTPLTDQLYQSLPLPRNVSGIFALAPGVVSGGGTDTKGNGTNPSIGGASGLENLYLVDGVNVTDQAFGGFGIYNRFWGSVGTGVNLAFIKEVDIKTTAFEPQYGKAAGGIVEIVTKAGSNKFHGAVAAYAGPAAWWADHNQPCQLGYTTTAPNCLYGSSQFDISGEVGGYVPGFKDKLFFFGAFDPASAGDQRGAAPGLALYGKTFSEGLNERSWAAKLSYQPFANTQVELSSFGDPSFSNTLLTNYSANAAGAVSGRYNFANNDTVFRLNQVITPTWSANLSGTYNIASFKYSPQYNNYGVQDRTTSPYVSTYVGAYYPTHSDDYSFNLDSQKIVKFFGQHTISLGYTFEHTNFVENHPYTGTMYAIPGKNAAGTDITSMFGVHSAAIGQLSTAFFRMYAADSTCTYCATKNGVPVYLAQYRGSYAGFNVLARSRYNVGWGNDNWQLGRHINVGLGLRWEEQWYDGQVLSYLFNDNWSPRLGINWDPKGDHRTKIFFNYARYQSVLPLDAAIRQLGNEQDITNLYYTPAKDSSGKMLTDSFGAPVITPDTAHLLNGTPGADLATGKGFGNPSFSSSTGEAILPNTKMEYENEYVFGFQREVAPGMMLGVRYTDRRLGRVVEDIGSESPEGSNLAAETYSGGIANVSANSDYFVNENEVTYTPAQWTAANGTNTPGMFASGKNTAPYVAPVAGCTKAGDTTIANAGFFTNYSGASYNGACVTNVSTAGTYGADGKPDGFADPKRKYQEFVVEFARNMKNNWQARANFRYARLWGNYEGFFRNDNGQSDPGISSLFDFTNGALGLLGDQTTPGLLNTDRRMVFNGDISYLVNDSTKFISALKGLTVGTNVRGMSGTPQSAYMSHPIYGNTGEVPVGGRGTKGVLPSRRQVDLHADYPIKIHEGQSFKFAFDAFNITDTKLVSGRNQNLDTSPGSSNPDYNKVSSYQNPFYARISVKYEF